MNEAKAKPCWCCGRESSWIDDDYFPHCELCELIVKGHDETGMTVRICSCKGPPETCHACHQEIVWNGQFSDINEKDKIRHGTCECEEKKWGQIEHNSFPSVGTEYYWYSRKHLDKSQYPEN